MVFTSVPAIEPSGRISSLPASGHTRRRTMHAGGFRVWPFEAPALGAKVGRPLLVEIYPRLLTGEVNKGSAAARGEKFDKREAVTATVIGEVVGRSGADRI